MEDIVTNIDNRYHTKSYYKVEIEDNGNATCSKKLNYCPKKANISTFGLQSFSWLKQKSWALISNYLKDVNSLPTFQDKLKKFRFENCPCKLCKEYIQGISYIN